MLAIFPLYCVVSVKISHNLTKEADNSLNMNGASVCVCPCVRARVFARVCACKVTFSTARCSTFDIHIIQENVTTQARSHFLNALLREIVETKLFHLRINLFMSWSETQNTTQTEKGKRKISDHSGKKII